MGLVNVQILGVICSLLRSIASFETQNGIFCLLDYTTVDLLLGFLVKRPMMAVDWSAHGCAFWLPDRWKTDEVFRLEDYAHVVREHGHCTEQFISSRPSYELWSIRHRGGRVSRATSFWCRR